MAKVINISDRLSNERPKIVLNGKEYEINDSMEVVFKFEELTSSGDVKSFLKAMEIVLGKEAVKELQVEKMSIDNFKIWVIAILAAVQGISYEEAEARFRKP